jgi:predicted CoA-substrate-specific enzyme activase
MASSQSDAHVLGLDVGAISLSAAVLDREGEILRSFYELHHGDVEGCLETILEAVDLSLIGGVAATTSTPASIRADHRFNNQICLITAGRRFHPEARSILVVGGERFGLVRFDAEGAYLSFKANPMCAAGTGSFLDQQAQRLNLRDVQGLMALALANDGPPAKIASRCAVFAKTDLVHAQQEGQTLEAICDGLCRGVAKNIVDTLFTGETIHGPVLMVGGVARNPAVVRHLRELLGEEMVVDGELPHGAVGAALRLLREIESGQDRGEKRLASGVASAHGIIDRSVRERPYEYPPLELQLSEYPDFESLESSVFRGRKVSHSHPLEVDLYRRLEPGTVNPVYLGVDIGSTSTKAVLTDPEGEVVAGFYTSTAGKPLVATQLILEAVADWASRENLNFQILGTGTTGAGRKFIGRILGADLVLDEITAHARAAVELHPRVDTIIEIGGQDSKFTTLRDGRVTLSVMNNVCAAGTGSFIEEQARRLEVPLAEYGERTRGCSSPIASERCTVFMERDLNHYMSEGYSTGEVLAAVLHSVRENYLNKVAVEAAMGDTIAFQGATARNRALVAAFEQRVGKPILVSPYCHLTGALGVALILRDDGVTTSTFRGVDLHQTSIPIRSEICDFCTNHCKLSVAEVGGDTVAYGFLCGRDYEDEGFVQNNTSGFDLLKERRKAFRLRAEPLPKDTFTVGIPAALHLFEDLPFWKKFFNLLGVRTVTSERYGQAVKDGRLLAGAELCAPMTAFYAHVQYLRDRCDVIFAPFYLEKKSDDKGSRRQLCYYTQFAPSVGSGESGLARGLQAEGGGESNHKVLSPLVFSLYGTLFTKAELFRTLRQVIPGGVSPLRVNSAYDEAVRSKEGAVDKLKDLYHREVVEREAFHVVLLGRPYTVLSEWMNKGIPQSFGAMGVPTFYQDMLTYSKEDVESIAPLLQDVHWHYAAKILEAAEVTAQRPGAYPVLVTSFKCSPDSFITDYVRQILEAHGKPYLVLQLDEHDSRLGYETRIEAAVRAFRNHFALEAQEVALLGADTSTRPASFPSTWASRGKMDLADKTILFPNWDPLSLRLLVAGVRKTGRDARLLEPSEEAMRRSLRHNSGQCTPLNIIAQDFMEYVDRYELDPAKTVLWMAAASIACNIRLYPYHIRTILRSHGQGFEKSDVFAGAMSLQDISATLPYDAYLAYMFGGFLRRMGCRVRPYEVAAGETDRVIEEGMRMLEEAFESDRSKERALAEVVSRFEAIEVADRARRPEVAIFGDLYSRDNRVLNQDLVQFIEAHGGEVITTPYTSYVKMVLRPYYWKWFLEGQYLNMLSTRALMAAFVRLEKKYFRYFERILGEPEPSYDASPQAILSEYNVRVEHTGEAMDNLLKVFYITRHHPDVALFVQASPAFCCPSLVTEAMAREIEEKTGVPVVSVTYDGTGGAKNDVILPYLEYPRGRGGGARRLQTV